MSEVEVKRKYNEAMEQLAVVLKLKPSELATFCGGIEDGDWGIRRLKEFFRGPEVTELMDTLIDLCEEYQRLRAGGIE